MIHVSPMLQGSCHPVWYTAARPIALISKLPRYLADSSSPIPVIWCIEESKLHYNVNIRIGLGNILTNEKIRANRNTIKKMRSKTRASTFHFSAFGRCRLWWWVERVSRPFSPLVSPSSPSRRLGRRDLRLGDTKKIVPSQWTKIWNGQEKLGLILGSRPANERRRYFVTMSLIGWAQAWNQPWGCVHPQKLMILVFRFMRLSEHNWKPRVNSWQLSVLMNKFMNLNLKLLRHSEHSTIFKKHSNVWMRNIPII